jgi:hypothetical protein
LFIDKNATNIFHIIIKLIPIILYYLIGNKKYNTDMKYFDYIKYKDLVLTQDIIQLLLQINLYKGKHNFFTSKNNKSLNNLKVVTRIQSIDASNKIEGIATTSKRLKELIEQKTQPINKAEEEIDGYRKVFDLICES